MKGQFKYHYVFYVKDKLYGVSMVATAQDKFMFDLMKHDYIHSPQFAFYKRERITKEEWKRRYC